jgi:dienelactone hydrolase
MELLLCYLLFFSSICFNSAFTQLITRRVDYVNSLGETLEGYLSYYGNNSVKRPALLAAHDMFGLKREYEVRAEEFAAQGYVGFAIDMYGKGKVPANNMEAISNLTYLFENPDVLRSRAQAALDFIATLPEVDSTNIGACGYCLGGTVVLEMSRSETAPAALKGVVSFHGDPLQVWPDGYNKFTGSVVVIHAALDTGISDEDVLTFEKEAREQEIDWVTMKMGNVGHGFTTRGSTAYNVIADHRAHSFAFNFFDERFNAE